MESFFATLKTECVDRRYATRGETRLTIFEYLKVFYNNQRRHSALGYLSPVAFERLRHPAIPVSTKWGEDQFPQSPMVTFLHTIQARMHTNRAMMPCSI